MRVDVARCAECSRVVPLPSFKTRRVVCEQCIARAREKAEKAAKSPPKRSGVVLDLQPEPRPQDEEMISALRFARGVFGYDDEEDDDG